MALRSICDKQQTYFLLGMTLMVLSAAYPTPVYAEVKGAFLYNLSNFTGAIPYNTPRLAVDKERNEINVLFQNAVSVFNEQGMEIYRFGDDLPAGKLVDLTVDGDGNVMVLHFYRESEEERGTTTIIRCNYRGEPTGRITMKEPPAKFGDFSPLRMLYQNGLFYLADTARMKIVVADEAGNFKKGYDLIPLLELEEKERGDVQMGGFSVGTDGNILFTIPVRFSAHTLSPDGKIASFGKPGGAPGKFNIVTGIVSDSRGNYLVVDKLKCAVLVFDNNFNYLTQFGYRGWKTGELIAPEDIAIDKRGMVYVTQNGRKGVSVYQLTYN
jgi:DNA-binding beta-propeller fold protein YncE